jgi:hypothetical protein
VELLTFAAASYPPLNLVPTFCVYRDLMAPFIKKFHIVELPH